MAQKVEISRGALSGLVAALVVCLMALAFLMGRQSATPQAAASPTSEPLLLATDGGVVDFETPLPPQRLPAAAPPFAARPATRPSRPVAVQLRRSEGRPTPRSGPAAAPQPVQVAVASEAAPAPIRANRPAPSSRVEESDDYPQAGGSSAPAPRAASRPSASQTSVARTVSPAESDAVHRYLQQVDAAVAGTQSMDDANAFATQLLQQSMQGDTSAFDQLIGSSESALRDLKAIQPPARCKEHHSLMVGQLNTGLALLRKVKGATVSMDTTSLATLSMAGKDMQSDLARLQQLDRELRSL